TCFSAEILAVVLPPIAERRPAAGQRGKGDRLPAVGGGIKAIFAVDASTGKLINAKSALYVVGSDIPNTMGSNQVAFASKSSAKAFQKKHGGKIVSFNIALKN
ncbi:MAG TPA: hypothetical protein ENK99_01030, partial [Campylobacterales bacterium]|nr:hypothetical protein [Campylobacterales bacterium]